MTKNPPPDVTVPKYPARKDDRMLEADEGHLEKHIRREELTSTIKALTAEKAEIDQWFKSEIGENLGIQNDAMRYVFKENKAKEVVDYQGLVYELQPDPELVAKYTSRDQGNRVLRSLKPKGGE